jgi:hypothetical protein
MQTIDIIYKNKIYRFNEHKIINKILKYLNNKNLQQYIIHFQNLQEKIGQRKQIFIVGGAVFRLTLCPYPFPRVITHERTYSRYMGVSAV